MTQIEKQIEEMANILCEAKEHDCKGGNDCLCLKQAEAIYNASYRKQEWISVEDRLPTYKDGKVLIYTAYGISIAEITVSGRWKGANAIPKFITHWKPLPEPPKMKGE